MAFGKSKTKTVSVKSTPSVFKGVNTIDVGLGDLLSAQATRSKNGIAVNSRLNEPLSGIQEQALSGLSQNLGVLGQPLAEQLQGLLRGDNSYYNLQQALNNQSNQQALDTSRSRYANRGLENSTVRGAFEAGLQQNNILQDLETRQAALDYQNQLAQDNAGLQQKLLDSLAQMQAFPISTANNTLLDALQAVDTKNKNNEQLQLQAAIENARLAQEQEKLQPSAGSVLGSLGYYGLRSLQNGLISSALKGLQAEGSAGKSSGGNLSGGLGSLSLPLGLGGYGVYPTGGRRGSSFLGKRFY